MGPVMYKYVSPSNENFRVYFAYILVIGYIKIEGGEGVSLGADSPSLVLAGVIGITLYYLDTVSRRAFHLELVSA